MIDELAKYDYKLPASAIANIPITPRDHSKLLVLNRHTSQLRHHHFYDLPSLLTKKDVLVLNQTKVIPARLFAQKSSGGRVEILLIRQRSPDTWEALTTPGVKLHQSLSILPSDELKAKVIKAQTQQGHVQLQFNCQGQQFLETISTVGHTPIPPYIQTTHSEEQLRREYQTVYAHKSGSVAAPTAGLHFTSNLLQKLKHQGVSIETITLHVGPGTFQRLRQENLDANLLHQEQYEIKASVASRLNQAKQEGKRIIAVGTTTTRTLEAASYLLDGQTLIKAGKATTQLFIRPPFEFKFIDGLITNFHLPQSSLLMLVAAFTTKPQTPENFSNFQQSSIGQAYRAAIENDYRFYSFGDAMFMV